ncbi:MAG: hypothetical protein JSU07_13125 [Bacteroidetes bacterium]|nr:hypothetical protein [Bacteroidota bacterium]
MKKKLFYLSLCLASYTLSAQTHTSVNIRYTEKPNVVLKKQPVNQNINSQTASNYLGLDAELASYFKENTIPASVPKAEKNTALNEYKATLNTWLSSNQNSILPEKRNKFIK